MAVIIPAILEDNIDSFNQKIAAVLQIPNLERIQIDISDGEFTPKKTVQFSEMDVLNPAYFWEAHLMVNKPRDYFFDAKLAGINSVIVHFESLDKKDIAKLVQDIKDLRLGFGLGITLATDIEDILPYAQEFEQILILGVNPGFQGQEIDPAIFDKVKKLKSELKNVKIEVDGGVKVQNALQLANVGADMLVVGSAVFAADKGYSPAQNFEEFEKALKTV